MVKAKKSDEEEHPAGNKKEQKSLFRRVNAWLHLWLGLISGIIVFIVCLNASIWVFNEEITDLLKPHTAVAQQDKPVLTPSQIQAVAARVFPGQKIGYASYQQGRAIYVSLGRFDSIRYVAHLHPYTGQVLESQTFAKDESDFFRFILDGHRFLWLPWKIGRPIVNYGTMVFVVLLITGLIWWYPKKWTKSTREKSFTIKWGASFKRVNLDLHNVFGFYAMLFLLTIALTGMVWGIEWYSKGLYWVTSGGENLPERSRTHSDSTQVNTRYRPARAMDNAWATVLEKHPQAEGFFYSYPDTTDAKSSINITIYPSRGQFYNSQAYAFDRHTLQPLQKNNVTDASFEYAPFGAKLRRMNYDIHVGSILGLPGKVLAFFASLIGASLPVTGFLIWWNRKFKKPKSTKNKKTAASTAAKTAKPRVKIPSPIKINV